jgi:hypothetical protein
MKEGKKGSHDKQAWKEEKCGAMQRGIEIFGDNKAGICVGTVSRLTSVLPPGPM